MLVLARKLGERILVGDAIVITVVRTSKGSVRLGIEAPDDVAIIREELRAEQNTEQPTSRQPFLQKAASSRR